MYFVSGNKHKFDEINLILSNKFDLKINFINKDIVEVQSDKIEDVAVNKSIMAFNDIKKPIIIEDSGLFINSLNGFPGPYSSFVLKTIGNEGILRLLGNKDRAAIFKAIIVYNDGHILKKFVGQTKGNISKTISDAGWGYDPIFVPFGSNFSYAVLGQDKKNSISHRNKAINKFATWFTKTKKYKL